MADLCPSRSYNSTSKMTYCELRIEPVVSYDALRDIIRYIDDHDDRIIDDIYVRVDSDDYFGDQSINFSWSESSTQEDVETHLRNKEDSVAQRKNWVKAQVNNLDPEAKAELLKELSDG